MSSRPSLFVGKANRPAEDKGAMSRAGADVSKATACENRGSSLGSDWATLTEHASTIIIGTTGRKAAPILIAIMTMSPFAVFMMIVLHRAASSQPCPGCKPGSRLERLYVRRLVHFALDGLDRQCFCQMQKVMAAPNTS
jgi:hypothetical protein